MLSSSHLVLLGVIVIILILGPAKLPALGKGLGDAIRGFKKGMNGEDDSEIDVTHSAREKLHSSSATEIQNQKQSEKNKV